MMMYVQLPQSLGPWNFRPDCTSTSMIPIRVIHTVSSIILCMDSGRSLAGMGPET